METLDAPARAGLLARLKSETETVHRALERHVDLGRRLSSPERYRDLLVRWYGFHVEWEPHIEAALGAHPVLHGRRKAHLLADDLHQLGIDSSDLADAPRCPMPPLRNDSEAFGALYVIEGATLGGAVIAKQVRRRLGFTPTKGCSFFQCYGDHIGARWKEFGAHAETFPAQDPDSSVRAAQTMFRTLHDWL